MSAAKGFQTLNVDTDHPKRSLFAISRYTYLERIKTPVIVFVYCLV